MTDLPALLMLAEKATAGSRELDYAIAEWAHSRLLASYRRLDGDNGWYSDDPPISGANKIAPADAYTFSIDCALGLVEQMKPGWFWRAGHVPSFHWHNGATYDRLIRPLDYADKLALIRDTDMPVTRLMNVGQMTEFMDAVFQRHAEFGIALTVPPDRFAYSPREEKAA